MLLLERSHPLVVTRLAMHYAWGDGVGYLWQHETQLGVRWVNRPNWGIEVPWCTAWHFETEADAIDWWEKCVRSTESYYPEVRIKEPKDV